MSAGLDVHGQSDVLSGCGALHGVTMCIQTMANIVHMSLNVCLNASYAPKRVLCVKSESIASCRKEAVLEITAWQWVCAAESNC